ncbi:MAG TPA: hypothetical protein VGY99_32515 [Candidatus Binataceae bacterium]|nr:hypothetical protein [Candidatus Binataceae bacterium]
MMIGAGKLRGRLMPWPRRGARCRRGARRAGPGVTVASGGLPRWRRRPVKAPGRAPPAQIRSFTFPAYGSYDLAELGNAGAPNLGTAGYVSTAVEIRYCSRRQAAAM